MEENPFGNHSADANEQQRRRRTIGRVTGHTEWLCVGGEGVRGNSACGVQKVELSNGEGDRIAQGERRDGTGHRVCAMVHAPRFFLAFK